MSWFAPMDLPSSPPSSSDGVDRSSASGTGSVPSIPDGAAAPIDPQARSPAEITSVSCLGPLFATLFSRRQTAPDSAAGVAKAAKKAEKAAKAPKKRAYSGVGYVSSQTSCSPSLASLTLAIAPKPHQRFHGPLLRGKESSQDQLRFALVRVRAGLQVPARLAAPLS